MGEMNNDEFVILTKEEIKKRFEIYNQKYFWGKLGKCKVYIFSKNIQTFGKYTDCKLNDGTIQSKIYIGQSVKWTNETLELIIVHEMIHMYVTTVEGVKFDGLLGHGKHFRKHQKRIKKEFGLNIEIHPTFQTIKTTHVPLWERVLLWLIDR